MDLRVFTEPQQGATYDDLLAVARRAEELGFDAFFRSDHYLAMGADGLPGPTDAWVTLAGLARETSTIRLGTLMTSATFRLPGPAGDLGGAGRPDERRPGRARASAPAGSRPSTRRTASRSRRPASGSTGSRSRWRSSPGCGRTPDGEHVRLRRRALPVTDSPALPKPVQSAAPAGDHRRQGQAAHAGAGRPLRRRVQRAVRLRGRPPGRCSPGSGRRARTPGRDPDELVLLQRPGALRRPGRGRGGPPRRRHRPRRRRAPRERPGRHPAGGRRPDRGSTPRPGRPASTCRCSTSPTSTTSTWSPRRSCRTCDRRGRRTGQPSWARSYCGGQ